jgi:hypothetical protein
VKKKILGLVVPLFLLVFVASGCGAEVTSTSALCAFVVGDGDTNHDAKVHKIVYPDDDVDYNTDTEEVKYFPCNSRNYLINDGTVKNANGNKVGDRFTPSIAYTTTGTKMKINTSTYWTPNQARPALLKFHDVLFKYNAFSGEAESGTANFSTPGWNGMLGEVFGPSVDQAAFEAAAEFDDELWSKPNPTRYKKLGLAMSNAFADKVRAQTGYNEDLFCGSGNSGWDDSHKNFTCTNVRIVVTSVVPFDGTLNQTATKTTRAEQELKANAKRLAAAKAIYGDLAEYWLGLQDTLAKCSRATCVISIGGNGSSPSISVTPTGKAGK